MIAIGTQGREEKRGDRGWNRNPDTEDSEKGERRKSVVHLRVKKMFHLAHNRRKKKSKKVDDEHYC